MFKMLKVLPLVALACILSSCASVPLDADKILDLKPDEKLYTAFNLWFDEKREVHHVNYHRGTILPFGTEVKIVKATHEDVIFKVVGTGDEYRIVFIRKFAMYKGDKFLQVIFTKKSPEQLTEKMKPETVEKIRKGEVVKGMTKDEVMLSFGYPQAHRTPSPASDTWVFFDSPEDTKRVVFNRKGLVLEVIKSEEVKK